MTDRAIEAACWRIWYKLRERGEATRKDLQASCGIADDVFDEAIQDLRRMGQVDSTTANIESYELQDDTPRMMQVFPTIYGDTDE